MTSFFALETDMAENNAKWDVNEAQWPGFSLGIIDDIDIFPGI